MITVAGPHCGLRPTSDLGGEVFERQLLERLPSHGVRLRIGLPRSRALQQVPPGWDVDLIWPGRWLRWYIAPTAFVPWTVRVLRSGEVDVLRGHSVLFTGPSLLAARALARSRVPLVLQHLHTDPRWTRLEAAILRRADLVLTISATSREQLHSFGVEPERIRIVYPGIERGPETVEPAMDAWPRPQGLRLLVLGRLVARKRPHLAVRALGELVRRGVDASLVVAGSGRLGDDLVRLAQELDVAQHVRFTGAESAEKWALYDAADVFVFPSELEGFGFVAAEAQSRGLPVVATQGTATAEIVEDGATGFLVAPDPVAFADAVARLADARLREEFGGRGRDRAARFDWDTSAAETARHLEEIARAS